MKLAHLRAVIGWNDSFACTGRPGKDPIGLRLCGTGSVGTAVIEPALGLPRYMCDSQLGMPLAREDTYPRTSLAQDPPARKACADHNFSIYFCYKNSS